MPHSAVSQVAVVVPIGSDISLRSSVFKRNSISFGDKSWASTLSLDLKSRNAQKSNQYIVCMSVQQAGKSQVAVSPLELETAKDPPLNLFKPKEPYTATIVSVERLVSPKAPGETCHIVIDHGGNVPYWEGQSYGVIPPVKIQRNQDLPTMYVCIPLRQPGMMILLMARQPVCVCVVLSIMP